jgi:hypothetical protein
MKRFVLFVLVAGLVLAVGSAWALTLQPGMTSYSWTSWSHTDLDENPVNKPYWDGKSSDFGGRGDGVGANIGHWLTKKGVFDPGYTPPAGPPWGGTMESIRQAAILASPGVPYPYLSDSFGNPLADVWFQSTTPNWAAIKIEIAGLRNTNVFGIYEKDNPNNKQQLFSGSDGPGVTIVFTPKWVDFGFYLHDTAAGRNYIWYSQSGFNEQLSTGSVDSGRQHFAFFRATPPNAAYPAYYIGVEDLPGLGDKDYQDFVVFVQAIPDASTLMLFLSGVPALALLRRKRA